MALNKVMLIGNLGRDPEIRTGQTGAKVASFSVATSERWKDRQTGEQRERTEWHRVVAFGGTADIAERYLRKGSKVYVEGVLQTRKWAGKDGVERYTTEVVVNGWGAKLDLLDPRGDRPPPASAPEDYGAATSDHAPPPLDDEIPF